MYRKIAVIKKMKRKYIESIVSYDEYNLRVNEQNLYANWTRNAFILFSIAALIGISTDPVDRSWVVLVYRVLTSVVAVVAIVILVVSTYQYKRRTDVPILDTSGIEYIYIGVVAIIICAAAFAATQFFLFPI